MKKDIIIYSPFSDRKKLLHETSSSFTNLTFKEKKLRFRVIIGENISEVESILIKESKNLIDVNIQNLLVEYLANVNQELFNIIVYINSEGVPRTFKTKLALSKEKISKVLNRVIDEKIDPVSYKEIIPDPALKLFAKWFSTRTLDSDDNFLSVSYDYNVPKGKIALEPRKEKAEKKLIIYSRSSDEIFHSLFDKIGDVIPKNSLIVLNNSKVVKAALRKKDDDGTYIHILNPFEKSLDSVTSLCPWKPAIGEILEINGGKYIINNIPVHNRDIREGRIIPEDQSLTSLQLFLEKYGNVPIPIYVNSVRSPKHEDELNYQNFYAKHFGSIAAPVAGLNFYPKLIDNLKNRGFEFAEVTLHIGYGTWKSLKNEKITDYEMDSETFFVKKEELRKIQRAKKSGRKILAVGTTSVRSLESVSDLVLGNRVISQDFYGETSIFIFPSYNLRVADMLLTTFAYPKTPIMAMAATFAGGVKNLKKVYAEALERDYLFYSYGDNVLFM